MTFAYINSYRNSNLPFRRDNLKVIPQILGNFGEYLFTGNSGGDLGNAINSMPRETGSKKTVGDPKERVPWVPRGIPSHSPYLLDSEMS